VIEYFRIKDRDGNVIASRPTYTKAERYAIFNATPDKPLEVTDPRGERAVLITRSAST
jgi:hypothetical protein